MGWVKHGFQKVSETKYSVVGRKHGLALNSVIINWGVLALEHKAPLRKLRKYTVKSLTPAYTVFEHHYFSNSYCFIACETLCRQIIKEIETTWS